MQWKIYNENRELGDFYTAAMVILGILGLQLLMQYFIGLLLYYIPLFDNLVATKLVVLMGSQLVCIVVMYYGILPFFNIQVNMSKPINKETGTTVVTVFGISSLIILLSIAIFSVLGFMFSIEPVYHPNTWLFTSLPEEVDVIIISLSAIFLMFTSVMFAELLYRRILIPLLEKQAMPPIYAVLVSSVVFSLSFTFQSLNLPPYFADLATSLFFIKNGSPAIFMEILQLPIILVQTILGEFAFMFTIMFLLGLACGTIFILTRNIGFCFLLSSFSQLVIYIGNLLVILEHGMLVWIHWFIGSILVVIGSIMVFQVYYQVSQQKEIQSWQLILSERAKISMRRGTRDLILISIGIFFTIQTMQFNLSIIPLHFLAPLLYGGIIIFSIARILSKGSIITPVEEDTTNPPIVIGEQHD